MTGLWEEVVAVSPVLATAIHNGHELSPAVVAALKLGDVDRLREEDPHTGRIAAVAPSHLVVNLSRFEVDLNRPRDKAVYVRPEDAWGLDLWHEPPSDSQVKAALGVYDAFYGALRARLDALVDAWGSFVVLDVHSYNHRRGGPGAAIDDPEANPEVNVGTGSLDHARWGSIVDRFMADLGGFDYRGRTLDVRENVRFFGGNMVRWIHATYPDTGCGLAIEFKKTFMDEWSGAVDEDALAGLRAGLAATLPGLGEELRRRA